MIDKLAAWVEKGVITVRVVTIVILAVVVFMWVTGTPLPESLDFSWKLVMGFWFGTEGMKAAFEMAKEAYLREHELRMKEREK